MAAIPVPPPLASEASEGALNEHAPDPGPLPAGVIASNEYISRVRKRTRSVETVASTDEERETHENRLHAVAHRRLEPAVGELTIIHSYYKCEGHERFEIKRDSGFSFI